MNKDNIVAYIIILIFFLVLAALFMLSIDIANNPCEFRNMTGVSC